MSESTPPLGDSGAAPPDTILSRLLRSAADEIDELSRLNDLLAARVAELEDEQQTALRAAYRRGYCTGWHTGSASRPRLTNPERHARGELRRSLNA